MIHVKCTHQSMPIGGTLSTEVREAVPIVDRTLVVLRHMFSHTTMTTVMAHHLDWLILTLDQSSTEPLTIICGMMGQVITNCCSYSQQEST